MSKVLRIEHEDGTIWRVPAEVVAYDRAEHYATRNATSTGGESYGETNIEDEMEAALEKHPEMLREWATQNMNWEDLEPHATRVDQVPEPVRHMSTASVEVVEV